MKAISFDVPALPPTINLLQRRWAKHNAMRVWEREIHAALGIKNLAVLRAWTDLRHRMKIEIVAHHKRKYDPDNLYSVAKIPNDVLKNLRCIVDDSAAWIDLSVSEVIGKEVKTHITITNLSAVGGNGKPSSRAKPRTRRSCCNSYSSLSSNS